MNLLTGEPCINVVHIDGRRGAYNLVGLLRHADVIANLDEPPLLRAAVLQYLAVIVAESLEHARLIPDGFSAETATEHLTAIYSLRHETIANAVDSYVSTINTSWFDLSNPDGLGQIKGAKPSVEQKPGKFQPLNPFRGIDSASTTAPTPAEVAKDILTLNIRGVRGITPMPDNGTVKYPGPGPALYTPVVWVELDTLRDTLFGLLTPELLDDDSVPVWRDPVTSTEGDNSGALMCGPRRALTEVTRIPVLEWNEDGTLYRLAIMPGVSHTSETILNHYPLAKLVSKTGKDGSERIVSPVYNYGATRPFPFQGIPAMINTLEGVSPDSVAWAAAYTSAVRKNGMVTVNALTVTHSNQAKISSLSHDTYSIPVELLPEAVGNDALYPVVDRRATEVAHLVSGATAVGEQLSKVITEIERVDFSSTGRDTRFRFFTDVNEKFQDWLLRIPPLPEVVIQEPSRVVARRRGSRAASQTPTAAPDTAFDAHAQEWRKTARALLNTYVDEYLSTVPGEWWETRDIAEKVNRLRGYAHVVLGFPKKKKGEKEVDVNA